MAFFSLRETSINPAVEMLNAMEHPARQWAYDVEFTVKGYQTEQEKKFHFFVRNIDKPKYSFKYEEINEYGYRHKVLTGIEMGDLSIEFIDDATNSVLGFINHYLRNTVYEKNRRFQHANYVSSMERQGFDTAGVRPQGGPAGTIITAIKVHQYSGFSGDGTPKGRIRTWIFEDPQIVNFDLDKHASEDDALAGFVVQFNFKNVVIDLAGDRYPHTPEDKTQSESDKDEAFSLADSRAGRAVTGAGARYLNDEFSSVWGGATAGIGQQIQGNQLVRESLPLAGVSGNPLAAPSLFDTNALQNRNGYVTTTTTQTFVGGVPQSAPSGSDAADDSAEIDDDDD